MLSFWLPYIILTIAKSLVFGPWFLDQDHGIMNSTVERSVSINLQVLLDGLGYFM